MVTGTCLGYARSRAVFEAGICAQIQADDHTAEHIENHRFYVEAATQEGLLQIVKQLVRSLGRETPGSVPDPRYNRKQRPYFSNILYSSIISLKGKFGGRWAFETIESSCL